MDTYYIGKLEKRDDYIEALENALPGTIEDYPQLQRDF
jgi:hypothetical protein